MYSTSGKIAFYHKNTSNAYKDIIATTTTNDGQWHHYLGVNDGTNLKIYIDGVLDNSNTNGSNGTLLNANGRIGARWNNLNLFSGLIDEVAIFNSELSASDITTIYNSGIPNNLNDLSTPPLSWWRMGEDATFDGIRDWNLVDQGTGGNDAVTQNIAETERVTDVPT